MVRVEVRPVLGEAVDGPYPVHEERLNGMLRDRLNALTRKTHAFAKTVETWDALVILCLSITGCGHIGPCGKRGRACRRGGGIGRGRQRWPLG